MNLYSRNSQNRRRALDSRPIQNSKLEERSALK